MATTILFFVIVALIIFIGIKFDINFGLLGIVAGLIIAALFSKQGAVPAVTAYFPFSLFFNLFIITLFYGFAIEAGAMHGIGQRIIYAFRDKPRLLPFVCFVMVYVVSAMGAGAMSTPLIVSGLVFSVAISAGYNPVIASFTVWSATMIGDQMPWMPSYNQQIDTWTASLGVEHSASILRAVPIGIVWNAAVYILLFIVMYFVFGGYKGNNKSLEMEKPEPFTKTQRFTVTVVLCVIFLSAIPQLIQIIVPNPVTRWMTSFLSIQLLAGIGSVILALAKVAKFNEVLKNRVPWGIIIMMCGMMFFMKFSSVLKVVETLSAPLTRSGFPLALIPALYVLINGVLTYFCDGRAVMGILMPLWPVLVAAGVPMQCLYIAGALGGAMPSFSPFSTGGAMALNGCPDNIRDKVVRTQMILPWAFLVIAILLVASGLPKLGAI